MNPKAMLSKLPSLAEIYEVLEERRIEEIDSLGTVLRHKKTGARVFTISNQDANKVFSIGFRTPPSDNTGVPHILEHSVLCGSQKFPVKDPFVELVKGSLNTFLNAMTYPDKTVYPIASCNEKDFQNLMDVYMDAVFHTNIHKEENIFLQEGWHYELDSPEGDLSYNGVVYNEMKGAFSSPESILDRCVRHVLFPDNCYGYESGGDPEFIPELTYEQFLNFHNTYYHPSNSFLYLYGNMDMEEKLLWLDAEYLTHYEEKQVDSKIPMHKPFERPLETEIQYPVTEGETEEDATFLSISTVVGTGLEKNLYLAFQILEYTLIHAPGAPLKQELLDAGIGRDIYGGYDNGILQPYFSVIAKDANKSQRGEFLAVVKGTLRKLADQGINKKSLLAGINYYEFRYRESDYGSTPKGLIYGLQCMDSWLYDADPMMHLQYQETFDFLKRELEHGYFEQLIKKYLLDNPYEAVVIVSPMKNLNMIQEEKLANKLAEYKVSLSEPEVQRLIERTEALEVFQDTPSAQEDLEKIPLLSREDITRQTEKLVWEKKEEQGLTVIHHNLQTSGIGYLTLLFSTERVPQQDLPYVGLLKSVLGDVDTKHYSYSDLTSEIHLNSGGVSFSVSSYPNLENPEKFMGAFVAKIRVLYDKIDFGCQILGEILAGSVLENEKRLGEIIGETRSRAKVKLENSGHAAAVSRATSYFSPTSSYNELTGGIAYYHFLEELAKDYDSKKQEIIKKLKEVSKQLFSSKNLLVSYTADGSGYEKLVTALPVLTEQLGSECGTAFPFSHTVSNRNEAFKLASQVNYVARCGSFRESGYEYTGLLKILKVIMSYDYLWQNIRVKGGAYGCMSSFGRSGEGYFASYRDPNLAETDQVYERVVEYLEQFTVEDRDMTKYVIGSISDLDTPMTPATEGARGLSGYLSKVTDEMLQQERDQILSATQQDIRGLAGIVKAVLATGSFCVVGNADKIERNKELFGEIKNLSNL